MTFINAIINRIADLEERSALRKQFYTVGIGGLVEVVSIDKVFAYIYRI
jgi:hypothetical protein